LKIIGEIGAGGLGYITATLMSLPHQINAPIRFYVDTGCSVTTISQLDALRIGLNYNSLQRAPEYTTGITGLTQPYILPSAGILFTFVGSSLLEYVGDMHVLPPSNFNNPISLLGLDVLKKFTIGFRQNNIILER
jgi:hypothetical protein